MLPLVFEFVGAIQTFSTLEVPVLNPVESFIDSVQLFILGQPIIFVFTTGLSIAIISVAGEILTYWVARLGGRPLIEKLVARRWLRIDSKRVERTEKLFSRWGLRLVIFGRIFPGLRTLVSLPAGLTHMHFGQFLGAALGGAFFWNTLLVGTGYLLGFKVTISGVSILG